MAFALTLRPFGLADLGWQLRLGELISQSHSPFLREPFALNHLGEKLTPNSWLAQFLYYNIYAMGGWASLRLIDGLLWLSGFFLAACSAKNRGALAIAIALIVAFVVALPSASIRPQSFAALAFGLTLLLLRNPGGISAILSVPFFIVWQNLHPSVSLAILVIGSVSGMQWYLYWMGRGKAPVALTLICVIAFASIFATPAGFSIVGLAADNTKSSLLFGASEWFPLWYSVNLPFLWPVIVSALGAGFVAIKQRAPLFELVPAVIMLVMTIFAARFILFYAIAIVPLIARLQIGHQVKVCRICSIISFIISVAMLTAMPVRFEPELPPSAVAKLGNGHVYSDPTLGGSIIFNNLNAKVSFDGRFYLYDEGDFLTLSQQLFELERDYSAFAVARFRNPQLVKELEHSPAWTKVYEDDRATLFKKR